MFDLFEEMKRMQERMNRLFEEFDRFRLGTMPTEMFAVDVIDEGDSIRVVADLPGFNKDEIEIYIEDGSLVIKAEKKEEREEKEKNYIMRERKYGEVYRKIMLPTEVDIEKAKANYNNGVLEIILPKTEKVARKTIKID
ncbi:MAG: Hsp20/alpha crystallin family protein [Archaeoglobaceae archaeon]|nr:Hsp20/alpha crystallin family protein [Archaeoglobaceae archaeon]